MPTIRDVARMASVSVGTVSNVLNGIKSVSPEKVERVNQAISALGYRRNLMASQLRSNRSRSIGLVIPDITNPFYPAVARGVEDYASSAGYNVFLCNKDRMVEKERMAVDALLSKSVAGILLYKPRLTPEEIREVRNHCALVLIDSEDEVDCDSINVDDYSGMVQMVRRVVDAGHRRIAFITGLPDSYSSMRRFSAFNDTMLELDITYPPEYIRHGDYSKMGGMRGAEALMHLPEPPTAIMAANDLMAIGALLWAMEHGVKVPEDLSIIGYDDTENASLVIPRLTTVHQPKYDLGRESATVLINRIAAGRKNAVLPTQRIVMPTRYVRRDTLAAPRV